MFRNFKLTIGLKFYAIIALSFLGLLVMVTFDIVAQSRALDKQKQVELTHLGEMALGIVNEEYSAAQKGSIPVKEAKARAAARIGGLRYDNGNYFWINDMHPRVVMHPIKPELTGQDVTGVKDGRGNPLYLPFVEVAKKQGSGFVRYDFIKPGTNELEPKLSRIVGFAPWGWAIGTGVFTDDLRDQAWETARSALVVALLVLLVTGVVSMVVARRMSKAMTGMTAAMRELAEGRFDVVLPGLGRRDEIGQIASAVEMFKVKAAEKARLQAEAEQAEQAREAQAIQDAQAREAADKVAAEERIAAERRATMQKIADEFEAAVGGIVDMVTTTSVQLEAAAGTLSKTADVTQELSGSVASSSEEASANVQAVA